jgi:hypothetical protein
MSGAPPSLAPRSDGACARSPEGSGSGRAAQPASTTATIADQAALSRIPVVNENNFSLAKRIDVNSIIRLLSLLRARIQREYTIDDFTAFPTVTVPEGQVDTFTNSVLDFVTRFVTRIW